MDAQEMQAAMAAVQAAAAADGKTLSVPGLSPAPAAPPAAPPPTPAAPATPGDQPRGPDGKFVPAETPPADAPVPAAPPTEPTAEKIEFDKAALRVAYKYLGEDKEADVADLLRSGKLKEVFEKAEDQERQKGKNRDLVEAQEKVRGEAIVAGQKQVIDTLLRQGYRFIPDPQDPSRTQIVPPGASQPTAPGTPDRPATDVAALAAKAEAEGTVEAFAEYNRALIARLSQVEAAIPRMLDEKLTQAQRESQARDQLSRQESEYRDTFQGEMQKLAPVFAKAGPRAPEFEALARKAALAESNRQPIHGQPYTPPTIESVLAEVRSVARLADAAAPVAARPAPVKAPTPVPAAGGIAAPVSDGAPPDFDMSSPDGKAKAAEWLRGGVTKALGREPVFQRL